MTFVRQWGLVSINVLGSILLESLAGCKSIEVTDYWLMCAQTSKKVVNYPDAFHTN